MAEFRIETERLILRDWREEDREPWHAMSCDPQVMATIGPLKTRAESDAQIDRFVAQSVATGYTVWALERREDGAFMGFCGFFQGEFAPIENEIEIGWRLWGKDWGRGYAREAAQACLDWGWAHIDADLIWAITTPGNIRSWGLMERLGMARHPELDFDHPNVPEGSPLKPHIAYSIGRNARGD
jgi:RimJ/RimL family protein N-acetyltransferase